MSNPMPPEGQAPPPHHWPGPEPPPYGYPSQPPGGTYPLPPARPGPRGVTVGIGVELFGIALAVFGLAAGQVSYSAAGAVFVPNPWVPFLGVAVAFAGLLLHVGRV